MIVPPSILERFPGPSYNVHPGPPEHPGSFPEVHAVNLKATEFGATLHEMSKRVDEGRIVDVIRFALTQDENRSSVSMAALQAAAGLMLRWGAHLARDPTPLPVRSDLRWAPRKWRKCDVDHLSDIDLQMPRTEIDRRLRATVGGLHGQTARMTIGTARYRLIPDTPDPNLAIFT